jgi:hypothetical protein
MRITHMIAAGALLVAAPALARGWDFLLTNETGQTIKTFELAPTGSGKWQTAKQDADDPADRGDIRPDDRRTIKFDRDEDQCEFDLRATFSDGTKAVWPDVDICENAYITIRYADGQATYTAD